MRGHIVREKTLEVAKIQLLELIVEDAGDGANGANGDWGVWLDPRLRR